MKEARVCIITGANAGIGKATALGLAKKGFRVGMICRRKEAAKKVQKEIIALSGNTEVNYFICDLSSQAQIRNLANSLLKNYATIDILINNAGAVS